MALLMIAAALAGCAESGTDGADAATRDAPDGAAPGSGTPADDDAGADDGAPADGGAPAGGHDAGDDGTATGDGSLGEWYAFAFDREVTTSSGETGRIAEFAFTNTNEDYEGRQVMSVRVVHEGTVTEPVRTQKMDFASGSYEPETIETMLTMHKLRHEVEVIEDTTGERQAGETATVTLYLPADELEAGNMFSWFFTKLSFDTAEGAGVWEWYVSDEMEQEMNEGGAAYLPYTEGEDASSWWGFEFMAATYGLGFFAGYATGEQHFEEGSWSYEGMSYSAERTTFDVGAHAFDGWHVQTDGSYDGSSASNELKVAPGLPIPVMYRFATSDQHGSSLYAYELTDIVLE